MKPICIRDGVLLAQSIKVVIKMQFVFWTHFVTVSGDDLGVMFDGSYDVC